MNEIKIKKAFTLVELIIVITILVILATISFISFQNYTRYARDSNRLMTIKNISKGLEAFQIKSGIYPDPENSINILAGTSIINKQGYFGESQSNIINIDKLPLDPLDGTKYIYSINNNKNKYQLLSFLEANSQLSFVNETYADDLINRNINTSGNNIGIVLNQDKTNINQSINIVNSTGNYIVILDNNTSISGTGNNLADLENIDSINAYITYNNLNSISKNKKVLIIYQSYHGSTISRELENKYRNNGFEVLIDTGATTLEKVKKHNPDIILCDEFAWSCGFGFLNTLYNEGYKIASIGNDTSGTILPIKSTFGGSSQTGIIIPYNSHFISRLWNNTHLANDPSRYFITEINPKAVIIAKDNLGNNIEVVYLEEDKKGRWIHYQGLSNINDTLFNRANAYILR